MENRTMVLYFSACFGEEGGGREKRSNTGIAPAADRLEMGTRDQESPPLSSTTPIFALRPFFTYIHSFPLSSSPPSLPTTLKDNGHSYPSTTYYSPLQTVYSCPYSSTVPSLTLSHLSF